MSAMRYNPAIVGLVTRVKAQGASHPGGLTALVGRQEELGLLLQRRTKAKAGEGQVVLLSGESRIGKSRLCAALIKALTAEPHTCRDGM
jgi:AAA ATPase domain